MLTDWKFQSIIFKIYSIQPSKPGNLINSRGKRQVRICQPRDDPDVRIIKDFKTVTVTILHEKKVNMLEIKGKIEVLNREVKTKYLVKWNRLIFSTKVIWKTWIQWLKFYIYIPI